jgi:N-acyl-phosphatidylethanolamine-hydrolysing phospholipase D
LDYKLQKRLRLFAIKLGIVVGGMRAAALYTYTISNPASLPAVPDDSVHKKHHLTDSNGFQNPWKSYEEMSGPQIGRALLWSVIPNFTKLFSIAYLLTVEPRRMLTGKIKYPDINPSTITVIEPTFLASRDASTSLRATWLGHACYYVEFPSGLRVLFDPVFEDRCSPFSFMGPKRHSKIPCQIKDIPIVDAVVISHSHYDHLSHPTILELHEIQSTF